MKRIFSLLFGSELEAAEKHALDLAAIDDIDGALNALKPIRASQAKNKAAVGPLLNIISKDKLRHEDVCEILGEIAAAHPDDIVVLCGVADSLDMAKDTLFLNAPPHHHPVFSTTIERLAREVDACRDTPDEIRILEGLSTAARIHGRQHDDLAELCLKRLVELEPQVSYRHYNLGLFYKTRGRFAEGVSANAKAIELAGEKPGNAYLWNLGICATGAGQSEIALQAWRQLDVKIDLGQFGLPEGRFDSCKVRVAERPLTERSASNDDPGNEEMIWIKRLSSCHGIVQSVLYAHIGVDYGDVILFDGAPITYHHYDDWKVPLFPHLATLKRRHFQFFDFAGTQDKAKALEETTARLPDDCVVYSHSESVTILCANCWNDPNTNHSNHESMTKHVVTGRIAAPASVAPAELLRLIDDAIDTNCKLYAPDLCHAAGLPDRAKVEQHRYDMLVNN
jgi:hypothetical protein